MVMEKSVDQSRYKHHVQKTAYLNQREIKMKRKKSSIPSAIWTYGAGEPTQGLDLLRDQLGGALWYWNALTRIEQARREGISVIKASASPLSPEEEKAGIDAENDRANRDTKIALKAARLHFGTYVLINKAMEAAKRTVEGPRLKHWQSHHGISRGGKTTMAEGRLGAHIMRGCTTKELATNTMLQIEMPKLECARDGTVWEASRGDRRRGSRTITRIRAGSTEGRKPIWVEFPTTIHRPLPPDARIKAGWLSCNYVGTKWKYELQLQIESATFQGIRPTKTSNNGTVAIDLCWRRRDNGIRIAYACDGAGAHREILMPEDVLLDIDAAYALKGKADKVFDDLRDRMADEFGSLDLPQHFARRFEALRLWKSAQRLAESIIWWHDNRFVGDMQVFTTAWDGLQRWRHLYQYHTGVQQRALGRRKKYYEDLVKQLVDRYDTVVVGDFDMRDCVELDKKASDAPKAARHNRVAASPSEFRNVIKATARRLGAEVVTESCVNATRSCVSCGHAHELDPFKVEFQCEECGTAWDRGHNHCMNLLKRASGSVPSKTQVPLAPMFPQVLATKPTKRKIRDRTAARRSKVGEEVEENIKKSGIAVENLAQEV